MHDPLDGKRVKVRDGEWFQGLEKGQGVGAAHGDGVSMGGRENAGFGAISQACTGLLRPLQNL